MTVDPRSSPGGPERSRFPPFVTRSGRALLVVAGLVLWGWGMAGLLDGQTPVWHVVAGVGGVALIILALTGPAQVLQLLFEGLTQGGPGGR